MLEVVFLQLRQRKKALHHSLKPNIYLRNEDPKLSSYAGSLLITSEWMMFLIYHAPLGVVWLAACIIVNIFLVKLSVVHIGFLHNLIQETELSVKPNQQCLPDVFTHL